MSLVSPMFASELIPLLVGDCLSVKFTLIRKPSRVLTFTFWDTIDLDDRQVQSERGKAGRDCS